ncbi:hypothetical protein PUNSTDRAFT_139705 [Punctularia strigosozonata HHB-11173 SS5]|uniref:Uncharacterized protein n=1 Tax=Punctularia strigosozonata (strain HHB-11173) TaxID=741275 RepID=R7S0F7_PUNST|nr:uncharacterized protein PUNSTDRAFT_139705 [Punctularia strigosozonata HHB-11173 SS5]EIN03272.1 hypothetical protein PUNSTDRAFT_139705 [Punctularia strigosozonata HHB-11173 SS5]
MPSSPTMLALERDPALALERDPALALERDPVLALKRDPTPGLERPRRALQNSRALAPPSVPSPPTRPRARHLGRSPPGSSSSSARPRNRRPASPARSLVAQPCPREASSPARTPDALSSPAFLGSPPTAFLGSPPTVFRARHQSMPHEHASGRSERALPVLGPLYSVTAHAS